MGDDMPAGVDKAKEGSAGGPPGAFVGSGKSLKFKNARSFDGGDKYTVSPGGQTADPSSEKGGSAQATRGTSKHLDNEWAVQ